MNIQQYISSGVIESYVLGLLTAQERIEFEQLCAAHPEIQAAREAFELQLEQEAMQNAFAPPEALKQKIADKIFPEKNTTEGLVKKEAKIKSTSSTVYWYRLAAAACFILLAGSLWWNISLQNENKKIKAALESSNNQLAQIEKDAKAMQGNPANKMAILTGTKFSPQSSATVYWDTTSHDVYLLVNNLPEPASDQQYQLWALLDGKPVDMGVFEITKKPLQLYQMKNVQAAQAFAITLEKKGGSPTPSLDKMVVIGNL